MPGIVLALWALAAPAGQAKVVLETDELRVVIDGAGAVASLFDRSHGVEYAAEDHGRALLRVRCNGRFEAPTGMIREPIGNGMRLRYDTVGVEAVVSVTVKPTHVTFELVGLEPLEPVDAVHWGPISTTISETVGEIVGVVRNGEYAIGIQSLNPKTMGGLLQNDEGRDASRGTAAQAAEWGSTLQAYSLDRSRPRRATVWGTHYPNMPVPPIEGETPVGSKIAVFGCDARDALARIGAIEVAEGLPHPEFDGVWAKRSPEPGRPYVVIPFGEETFDEILAHAVRANFATVYHQGPFKSWGHFELNPKQFPNGAAGLKACVEKAKKEGVRVGVHTLSNFINTNDPYVTPVPDARLAKTGASQLTADVEASSDVIPVASPEYFNNTTANWLHTVMIGRELIRYGGVSEGPPWRLLDCRRGAFGTKPAAHREGDAVAKLMDHPYKVFLSDFEMLEEIAIRLADLFDKTGLMHLDFDGHEGCWSTGQGDYGCEFFAKTFYDHLDHSVCHGSSVSKHFYWHINTAENWGEPYWGGFRTSQRQYRFDNQDLFERNFMPHMLGWFMLSPKTTLADIEWMLARCAGYDAGFALQTHVGALRTNGECGAILDAIREWDEARRAGAFSEEQRSGLRDPGREFHLQNSGEGQWRLYPFHTSEELVYEHYVRQPGEPTGATWEYINSDDGQPLRFVLEVRGERGSFRAFTLELDHQFELTVPVELEAGQTIACDGTPSLRVYDAEGRQVDQVNLAQEMPELGHGRHRVALSGEFDGDPPPDVVLRIKTRGTPEMVAAPRS